MADLCKRCGETRESWRHDRRDENHHIFQPHQPVEQETDEAEQGLPELVYFSSGPSLIQVRWRDFIETLKGMTFEQRKACLDTLLSSRVEWMVKLEQERDAAIARASGWEQSATEWRDRVSELEAKLAETERRAKDAEHEEKYLHKLVHSYVKTINNLNEQSAGMTAISTERDELRAQVADVARRQREACAQQVEGNPNTSPSSSYADWIRETKLVTDDSESHLMNQTKADEWRDEPCERTRGECYDARSEKRLKGADLDAANKRIVELEDELKQSYHSAVVQMDGATKLHIDRLRAKCSRQRKELRALNRKILEVRGAQVWWLNLTGAERAAGGGSFVWLRKQYKHYQELSRQQAEELSDLRAKESPEAAYRRGAGDALCR